MSNVRSELEAGYSAKTAGKDAPRERAYEAPRERSYVDRLLGRKRSLQPPEEPAAAAAVAARALEDKLEAVIAREGEDVIKLIEITSPAPLIFSDEDDSDHVWCLIVDAGRFSFEGALEWLRQARAANKAAGVTSLPSMVVLADIEKLSPHDHYLLSEGLPAGASFCRWTGGADRRAAFHALRDQLARSYGDPNIDGRDQWGRTPVGEPESDLAHG